ncbi:MAG: tRNA (adenosine(37)-N6)-threonylcarbamoyltransferase complex ATPase subunit type 1 TsaE [Hyphomicrobiaceae bacterium]|nr:tRNA (adenosine(37)-N6)-threonylcarbamoyltransferase complex ATPase subunit type 1 TsaE [Hyphomicrobiaceae bacterium]
MTPPWTHARVRESEIRHLAELLAFGLKQGDVVALRGDLGAGKTTLARAIIRAMLGDETAEVPSPTFSLVQTYAAPRFPVSHFDLYRLGSAEEARELGLDEQAESGAALIEWPERAEELLPADRIEVRLEEIPKGDPSERRIVIEGLGSARPRIERLQAIEAFLRSSGWADARLLYLQGDASPRRFGRLVRNGASAVLMDAPRQTDGPPIRNGKPYSRIANLAEDVRPYVAVAGVLRAARLSAPEILAQDLDAGLLLVEDLGDDVFGAAVGGGADQAELWRAAVDVLVEMRGVPVPSAIALADGSRYRLPPYDRAAMQIEVELLLDWYWPALRGSPVADTERAEYLALWNAVFDELLRLPTGWILRDFHSPNLMWLPQRTGLRRVGILDFQDTLEGHPAYDLVSLLQDARIDVPEALERELLEHYCAMAAAREPAFDRDAFTFAYAVLGAQRNTKILGIFTRLARRDGKTAYLRNVPRIWRYLERDLTHATLRPLKVWYDSRLPEEQRVPPDAG